MVVHRRLSCELCSYMWQPQRSALQTLHKVSSKAREQNYFQGGPTHDWVNYYEQRIESDRSCLNEWHAMDSLESRRPPSPDSIRTKPRERDETETVIRSTLKEIMMSVDLDEVTSKHIRGRLEQDLDMDLGEFKSFIDQEMLTILGQMDAPTEIFQHVYLGSEWNASNFEELQKNGVGHILNVTREIDNFFPGMFDYLNIRVYDDEKTNLLKHWDNTFKYITKAQKEGSKVLVHCKMGVSRSASVVIAYAMKAYNWDFQTALQHVKEKRSCIKPNTSFLAQLETYQGILDAMKNKEKLQRAKLLVNKSEKRKEGSGGPVQQTESDSVLQGALSGHDLKQIGARPKSWSPDHQVENDFFQKRIKPHSHSLENLSKNNSQDSLTYPLENARNVLMPLNNSSYSVSPNQIVHISKKRYEAINQLVKHRISELESQKSTKEVTKDKNRLNLNLTKSKPCSPVDTHVDSINRLELTQPLLTAKLVKQEIWDPGDINCSTTTCANCDLSELKNSVVWTSSTIVKQSVPLNNSVDICVDSVDKDTYCTKTVLGTIVANKVRKDGDLFSSQLDKVFDREERKQQRNSIVAPPVPEMSDDQMRECPSRQSSWSSYDSAVVLGYQGETRETPSRHSSWGSGDTRALPSRNSSWGSYDMKPIQRAVRSVKPELFESSSSGLFPYDRDEIPWYPGTVKRTKQKLEGSRENEKNKTVDKSPSTETLTSDYSMSVLSETEGPIEAYNTGLLHYQSSPNLCDSKKEAPYLTDQTFRSSSVVSKEIDIISETNSFGNKSNLVTRLSVSAPENSTMELIPNVSHISNSASNVSNLDTCKSNVIYTAQCSSVKKHKSYLENLHNKETDIKRILHVDESETNGSCVPGIVQNLKKEFEAKTSTKVDENGSSDCDYARGKMKGNGLEDESVEDISVKQLVGKYEVGNNKSRYVFDNKLFSSNQNKNMRYSCFEVLTPEQSDKLDDSMLMISPEVFRHNDTEMDNSLPRRPSIASGGGPLPSVVVATVMQAASKKQKHNCITLKPRNNNPVYNTM